MTSLLKATDLTPQDFLSLIGSLQLSNCNAPVYIWLEAPDGWTLDRWEASPNSAARELCWRGAGRSPVTEEANGCLARSTAGRLFGPEGELRWRVIPALGRQCWRTVFLGTADWVGNALPDYSDDLKGLSPNQEVYYLWGTQTATTPGEWIELRIPHRLQYPIAKPSQRVKVVVEQWKDDSGETHFVRLCELKS